jgi:hypothetical protein
MDAAAWPGVVPAGGVKHAAAKRDQATMGSEAAERAGRSVVTQLS